MTTPLTPERHLWLAVVELAIKDLRHPEPRVRRDTRRWFRTRWAGEVLEMAGLSPSAVRRELGT